MDTADLIAAASPIINQLGWAFYFVPATAARAEALGTDVIGLYFLGRGGVLGDVEAPVVTSAFGFFAPSLIEGMWDATRAVVSPREAGQEFMAACQDFGRAHLTGLDGLAELCRAAEAVNDAAKRRPAGLTLYAGAAAQPLPDDLPARAMQLITVLRELRGSAHVLAVVASGLDPAVAHAIKRPNDVALFGWDENKQLEVTEEDRAAWQAAEVLTDRIVTPAFSVLDDAGAAALVAGLERAKAAILGSA